MEPTAECMLVVIGATPERGKALLGFQVGVRESAQSWGELQVDLTARGLTAGPELAVGDGALGFPAEHWDHLRASNPIESVFATVRHRTVRTKGALSQKTARVMVFTLVQAASKKWRRLKGANRLPRVMEGVSFADGSVKADGAQTRAA